MSIARELLYAGERPSIIARKLGYKLVDHRLELYGMPLDDQ